MEKEKPEEQGSIEKGYVDLGRVTPKVPPGKPEENQNWPAGEFGGAGDDKPHSTPKQW